MEESQLTEFEDNPEPRCACVLLLDTSGSMAGTSIDQLNAGLQAFKQALSEDSLAMLRVDIAVITLGSVTAVQDFVTAALFTPPQLIAHTSSESTAGSDVPMGEAIHLALDKVEERKAIYKQNQIPYFRPWIFLFAGGHPADSGKAWMRVSDRIHDKEALRKVTFTSLGVEDVNMARLAQLGSRQPLKLREIKKIGAMIRWLSASLSDSTLLTPFGWGTTPDKELT